MTKGGIGMVLAPEYSDNKRKTKKKIKIVMIQFPLFDRTTPNSIIFTPQFCNLELYTSCYKSDSHILLLLHK
ncbi:hypothetical protein R3W88_026107 [Solanum pinnatisectum]|uniref:Uncharacterized protein n=1 Tax=Solanum pinnatisectum TaxID=50273 RepID=A0AAV9LDH7_9SOLN|nr:hypothetical protein R3W88_026107 [Solanum pinnatisectum]